MIEIRKGRDGMNKSSNFVYDNKIKMRKFYETYKDLSNLPTALAKLPWSFGVFSFYVNIYALKSKLKKSK